MPLAPSLNPLVLRRCRYGNRPDRLVSFCATMRFALLLLLTTTSLRADALTSLKETLQRLPANAPVAASVDFTFADSGGDQKKPVTTAGHAVAAVALGAEGLRITWSPEQLAAAASELASGVGKADHPSPTRQAMARLDATVLHDYLNAGSELLRHLETAQLVSEKDERWYDRPAHVLTLQIEPKLSAEDRKVIKEITATASVWVDADGLPLAVENTLQLKGRVMVVVGFDHSEKEQFTFARASDRLVVTSHHRETADNGGGQHAKSKTTCTLRLSDGL